MRRVGVISVLCLLRGSASSPGAALPPSPVVVSRFLAWERTQERQLAGYASTRLYVLSAEQRRESSSAEVRMTYRNTSGETFEVLQWTGAGGLLRYALQKVLESEADLTRPRQKLRLRLTEENYRFELLGTEQRQNRPCYVLRIEPRRPQRYLLKGRLWINTQDYGLVRLEGQASVNSFWIGQPSAVQNFQQEDDFWVLDQSEWQTKVRGFGGVSLQVESLSYQMIAPRRSASDLLPRDGFPLSRPWRHAAP